MASALRVHKHHDHSVPEAQHSSNPRVLLLLLLSLLCCRAKITQMSALLPLVDCPVPDVTAGVSLVQVVEEVIMGLRKFSARNRWGRVSSVVGSEFLNCHGGQRFAVVDALCFLCVCVLSEVDISCWLLHFHIWDFSSVVICWICAVILVTIIVIINIVSVCRSC